MFCFFKSFSYGPVSVKLWSRQRLFQALQWKEWIVRLNYPPPTEIKSFIMLGGHFKSCCIHVLPSLASVKRLFKHVFKFRTYPVEVSDAWVLVWIHGGDDRAEGLIRRRAEPSRGFLTGVLVSVTVLTTIASQNTQSASTSTPKRPAHCGCKQWTERWGESNSQNKNNTWREVMRVEPRRFEQDTGEPKET